jgi:transcription termination factor Rho
MAKKEKYNTMEQLSDMKVSELKAIAPEFEVKISKKMRKADIIKAIFDSKYNTYIDADAPTKANSVKLEKAKEEVKPVFKRPARANKYRKNFQ